MPSEHARLSASGAHQWLNCTPSIVMSEGIPDKGSSYAEEGTLAHSLAELMINYNLGRLTKTEFKKQHEAIKKNAFYSEDMQQYINEYVNQIWEIMNAAKASCKDAELLTEQRLDFSEYVPDGFGTGDVVIVTDGKIQIIDLKYGKGVEVFADKNPQLMLYGLGALGTYDMLYDIKELELTIVQPRLDNISTYRISADDLVKWGEGVVRPAALKAINGEGDPVPGPHCRFCKVKATCRARKEQMEELARMEFKDARLLDDSEIGEVLRLADQLANWVGDIKEYALEEAVQNGKKWDGWKLVEGRSNRKYSDEKAVVKALTDAGFQESLLFERKLYGITAMEKIVGKKSLQEYCGDLIVKPQGKPTLVPESDKRPELSSIDSAVKDFE